MINYFIKIGNMKNVNFNSRNWNAPKVVETPNIEEDIKQYLGDEILKKWQNLADTDDLKKLKKRIIVITERLDLVSHLKTIAMIVRNKSNYTEKNDGNIKSECNLFGHNFGGLQYDIEALDFYLHLTCIDAIQEQEPYKDPFDWLKSNFSKYNNTNGIDFDKAKNDYQIRFGLSKNFKKAFTEDISPGLKEIVSNVFMVVKMNNNQPNPDSLNNWNSKNESEKLNKIAGTLYEIRSKFTHTNIRSFYPVERMYKIPCFEPGISYLLWNLNYSLSNQIISIDDLLNEIIKELCLNKLENNQPK